MKTLPLYLLTPTLAVMALPLAAQTAPKTSTTPQTAAHRTTTAVRRPATSSNCATATPGLSPKIPALPVGSPSCPTAAYTLTYIDTIPGTGELAVPRKWYTVNYTGYLTDGTVFDTSIGKEPITFPYGAHRVISGWDTGFDGMRVGGRRRLFIPYQLAYGATGKPPIIPEKAMLIFDIQLISQSDTPPVPKTPAAAPTTAPPPPPSPAGSAAPPPVSSQTPATTIPAPTTTTPKK